MPYRRGGYGRKKATSSVDDEYMMFNEDFILPGDQDDPSTSIKSVKDDRLCKCYLVGICPHDALGKTKMDIGPCQKVHSSELREKYRSKVENTMDGIVSIDNEKEKGICNPDEVTMKMDKLDNSTDQKYDKNGREILLKVEDTNKEHETEPHTAFEKNDQLKDKEDNKKKTIMKKKYLNVEEEAMKQLKYHLDEAERRVRRNKEKIEEENIFFGSFLTNLPNPIYSMPEDGKDKEKDSKTWYNKMRKAYNTKDVLSLHINMLKATQESLKVGKKGLVNEAMKIYNEATAIKEELEKGALGKLTISANSSSSLLHSYALNINSNNYRNRICTICGSTLSVFDSDKRLADHFGGKLHLAYVAMRDLYEKLHEKHKILRENEIFARKEERQTEVFKDSFKKDLGNEKERNDNEMADNFNKDTEKARATTSSTLDASDPSGNRAYSRDDEYSNEKERERSNINHNSKERDYSTERGNSRERDRLEEKERRRKYRSHDSRDRSYSRERDSSRDREYSRGRDSSRDKEYSRNRDYSRDREYARGRDSSRDREYSRGRDYSRDRGYSRGRDYSRDRGYSRDRDYSEDRYMTKRNREYFRREYSPDREFDRRGRDREYRRDRDNSYYSSNRDRNRRQSERESSWDREVGRI